MSVLIRVEDEPPRTRLDYFRHAVADTIVPFGMRMVAGHDLSARILTGRIGTVHVTKVSCPPMTASRTSTLIRSSDPDMLKIDVQVRGHTVFGQDDREAALAPGDFTLVDLSRPCRLADRDVRHEVVAVMFPRALLPLPRNELSRLTAVRIPGDHGGGALVSSLARQLPAHLDDYGEADGARVGTAMLDLLTVALSARLGREREVPRETRQRALLLRVRAFIEERLGDPELSPGSIAAAHYISVRYLYKLFETQQTTVSSWIRQRRLERCRHDLLDPALRDETVGAIAARWGLMDPAHFSRTFRAAYGLAPTEYREIAGKPDGR
jgi:AraC-like DNA-binding protein